MSTATEAQPFRVGETVLYLNRPHEQRLVRAVYGHPLHWYVEVEVVTTTMGMRIGELLKRVPAELYDPVRDDDDPNGR
jgi:hypothetical protein